MTGVLSRYFNLSRTLAVSLLGLGLGVPMVRGQDAEAILPSWDEESTKIGDDAHDESEIESRLLNTTLPNT